MSLKYFSFVGMDASESKVQEVLAEYDVDGGNVWFCHIK
jgi:hypothetical protein